LRENDIESFEFERKDMNAHVCPWHMGHQLLLLSDARAARYLRRLVWRRDDFESNGKGGVGMAYGGHRGV
jgi:hypothetical protein